MRIRFTERGRGSRYIQQLKATRQLTGCGLKAAHRIVNACEWFECDVDEARALLDGCGVAYEVDGDAPDEIKALAAHIAATVEWTQDKTEGADGSFRDVWDADWMRGMLTADAVVESGGFEWTAWGYGSPCPEGVSKTLDEAKAAACYAMAESFIKAAAGHGLTVAVTRIAGEG